MEVKHITDKDVLGILIAYYTTQIESVEDEDRLFFNSLKQEIIAQGGQHALESRARLAELKEYRRYLESVNGYTDILIAVGGKMCNIPFGRGVYHKICDVLDIAIEEC